MIEVIMESDPLCPRCARLEPILRRITRELDIPFTVKVMSTSSVAASEESIIQHTFSPRWVEQYGLPQHKAKLYKIRWLLEEIEKRGIRMVPVVRIRWFDGARTKEIVIRGFDPFDENAVKTFTRNLTLLLTLLKRRLQQ